MIIRLKKQALARLAGEIEALEGNRRRWLETLKIQLSGLKLEAEKLKGGRVRIQLDELFSKLGRQYEAYLKLADVFEDEEEIILPKKFVSYGIGLLATDWIGLRWRRLKCALRCRPLLAV